MLAIGVCEALRDAVAQARVNVGGKAYAVARLNALATQENLLRALIQS